MKVKQNGKDLPWTAELACNTCESVLEIEGEDVKYSRGGGYFERDPSYYIVCPVCSNTTDLNESKLPKRIKHFAQVREEKRAK